MILNIEKRHLDIVNKILSKQKYNFFVFGSRITANAKRLSDLDLLYFEDIPEKVIGILEEEFEESDLPYKVDLVDYNSCDEEFKNRIAQNYIPFQKYS